MPWQGASWRQAARRDLRSCPSACVAPPLGRPRGCPFVDEHLTCSVSHPPRSRSLPAAPLQAGGVSAVPQEELSSPLKRALGPLGIAIHGGLV